MRYDGNKVGVELVKLIKLPKEKQPYISIFIKDKNMIFEGEKIDPDHCAVKDAGKTIQIGVRGQTHPHSVNCYYWTQDAPNNGPQEITWIEM